MVSSFLGPLKQEPRFDLDQSGRTATGYVEAVRRSKESGASPATPGDPPQKRRLLGTPASAFFRGRNGAQKRRPVFPLIWGLGASSWRRQRQMDVSFHKRILEWQAEHPNVTWAFWIVVG
jgi:hypothetical protein